MKRRAAASAAALRRAAAPTTLRSTAVPLVAAPRTAAPALAGAVRAFSASPAAAAAAAAPPPEPPKMSAPKPPFALRSHGGLINGVYVGAKSGATLDVVNPATGAPFTQVADMGREETLEAIAAAKAAFPAWAAKSPYERCALVRKLHDAMGANVDGLAALLTLECGKPFEEAKGEIAYAMSFLDWFAEEGKRHYGDVIPPARADRRMLTWRQPVGVAALLTPWNFSSAMVARKLAPALVAGCTVVCRPSANTPLSALAIVQLAQEVGFPAGVINLVVGDDHDALAGTLCSHPDVAKVSFTGSTRVGKLLMAQCAPTLKRLSMELGGDAPFIVFEDADVDAAVEGALLSKFRNAGQTCVCANRVFVHEKVYDEFRDKLVKKVLALKVGDGFTPGVAVGPVISAAARDKVEALVQDAVAKGAKVLAGGARVAPAGSEGGFFFAPTVLDNVSGACTVAREEIFGPLAPLQKFSSEADVVKQANAAPVGLAGYFYTRDLARMWRVAEALEVGMVGVNTGIISTTAAPFGGVKQSGFGREGSRYGLDDWTYIKYAMVA